MFTIISIMFTGIGIGYLLRDLRFLQKVEKSISLTIFLLLFVLGLSIGSNSLIINNIGKFGWQAIVLATLSILGSLLASFLVFHLFFKKGGNEGSLIVVAFFCVGCLIGAANEFRFSTHNVSMYVLYALMLQVGIGIGCNRQLKELIKSLRFKMLLVPVATITGTLLFSAFASLLLTQWSVFDCMAVGSGFAYYSLSSILITQFKEPSMGLQLATELGTIALLANIFREMMALLGAPLIRKYFGRLAPISAAGVNSMDVLLPSITRYSGKDMIPIAIFHGILIDMSVPVFVSFFCNL